jgi:type II secretory pathway component PulJ
MIGLTLGAFVVLGVLGATTGMLRGPALGAVRLDQELRNAAYVLERELSRSGYDAGAVQRLAGGAGGPANPFATLDVSVPGCVRYRYDLNENGALDTADPDERQAFALANGVLYRRVSGDADDCDVTHGRWEPLTDDTAVTVNAFTAEVHTNTVPIPGTTRTLAVRTLEYQLSGALRSGTGASASVGARLHLPNHIVGTP